MERILGLFYIVHSCARYVLFSYVSCWDFHLAFVVLFCFVLFCRSVVCVCDRILAVSRFIYFWTSNPYRFFIQFFSKNVKLVTGLNTSFTFLKKCVRVTSFYTSCTFFSRNVQLQPVMSCTFLKKCATSNQFIYELHFSQKMCN